MERNAIVKTVKTIQIYKTTPSRALRCGDDGVCVVDYLAGYPTSHATPTARPTGLQVEYL